MKMKRILQFGLPVLSLALVFALLPGQITASGDKNKPEKKKTADDFITAGIDSADKGDLKTAFVSFEQALKLEPKNAKVRRALGQTHIKAAFAQLKTLASYGKKGKLEAMALMSSLSDVSTTLKKMKEGSGKKEGSAKKPMGSSSKAPATKLCPVYLAYGKTRAGKATKTVSYKGQEIELCCNRCVKSFKANPEKFVKFLKKANQPLKEK